MARRNKAREAAERRVLEQRAADAPQQQFEYTPHTANPPARRFSRRTIIIALVVVLVLVIGAYCALTQIFSEDADEGESEDQELLLALSQDDIAGVSWTYNDQTTEVALEDDTWIDADNPDVALNQDSVTSIVSTLASATVERSISADSVTDAMGLDSPVVEAQLTLSDGSTLSLTIGASDDSGSYTYVRTSASDNVSLVSSTLLSALSTDITHLYETEDAPNASQVDSLSIEHDGDTLLLTYIEGGSEELSYSSEYEWFAGTDEDSLEAVDEDSASLVADAVNNISWESCVDPDYDGSTDYGFDTPTLTATLDYTNQENVDTGEVDEDGNAVYDTEDVQGTFTLIVGDETSDGSYYAQPEGSSAVYTMDAEDVETLLNASVESMKPDDVCLMDWDTVESMDITYNGQTSTIEFVREDSDDDDSNDSDTTYTIDGENIDTSSVEDLLDAIDNLAAESEADGDAVSDEYELSFTFYRNTSSYTKMTLGFTQYDNSFYLVSFNDEQRLLVNRNDVAELEELIDAL